MCHRNQLQMLRPTMPRGTSKCAFRKDNGRREGRAVPFRSIGGDGVYRRGAMGLSLRRHSLTDRNDLAVRERVADLVQPYAKSIFLNLFQEGTFALSGLA